MAAKKRKFHKKGIQTKLLFLEKAIEVFAERGFHVARVDEICKAAGLAKGTIYQYYKSKDAILIACLEELQEKIVHNTEKNLLEMEFKNVEDFRFAVTRTLDGFLRLYWENVALLRIVFGVTEGVMSIQKKVRETYSLYLGHYEKLFSGAQRRGFINSKTVPSILAQFTVSMVYQTAYQLMVVKGEEPTPDLSTRLSDFLFFGVQAAPSGTASKA